MIPPPAIAACCPACASSDARHARRVAGFELLRCVACRLVYVWPRPDRAASASSYAAGRRGDTAPDQAAIEARALLAEYDAEHSPYVRYALRQRLMRLHRRRPLGRMLDFGCGSGHLLGLARESFGTATFGIELHPVASAGAARFGFGLHAGPLETCPFAPASFDLAYSVQVFEHLSEPRVELARLFELLAPGGLLYLEVPNDRSLGIRLGQDRLLHNRPPGHLNFFTPGAMRRLLEAAGLEVLALRTTGFDYRSLFGLQREAGARASARPAVPRPAAGFDGPPGLALRARLRLLRSVDTLLSVPGWGVQLEALGRRPR